MGLPGGLAGEEWGWRRFAGRRESAAGNCCLFSASGREGQQRTRDFGLQGTGQSARPPCVRVHQRGIELCAGDDVGVPDTYGSRSCPVASNSLGMLTSFLVPLRLEAVL